jgi:hypothetical protein
MLNLILMEIVKVKILILMLLIILATSLVIKIEMVVLLGYLKNTLKRMMMISLIINIESNVMIVTKNKRKIIIKEVAIQTTNIRPLGHN